MSQYKSIKDELPEEGRLVIGYMWQKGWNCYGYPIVNMRDGMWCEGDTGDVIPGLEEEITHWTYFPLFDQ